MGCTVIGWKASLVYLWYRHFVATTCSVFSVYEIKDLGVMFVHIGNVGKAKQIWPFGQNIICSLYLSYDCPFKSPGGGR